MSVNIKAVHCGIIQENAYIISRAGRDDCVVVDPGDDYARLRQAVSERQVGAILLTHGHFDHILAVAPLADATGAPVYIHEADAVMLNDSRLNGFTDLMGGVAQGPEIAARPMGEHVEASGLVFAVLHTPGHSKGSVCLYLPEEGVLFSGDTLFEAGHGRVDLYGGDMRSMLDSLRALFALPGETKVYPGHGGPTTIARERARYRL